MPIGRLPEIVARAERAGFDVKVDDKRPTPPDAMLDRLEWEGPPPWDHQRRLVEDTLAEFSGGSGQAIWRAPGGSGKTKAALLLALRLNVPTLITANSVRVFRQWVAACEECLGFRPGRLGDGQNVIHPAITICMQQTAWRRKDLAKVPSLLICDEAQGAAAQTLQKFCDANWARYRLATSGDERRSDKREFLIYDQFGADVQEVTEEEVNARGETLPVDVDVVMTDFSAEWYVTKSPDEKFRARTTLIERMVEDPERNAVVRRLVAACRLEREQVLVMTERVDHARSMLASSGEPSALFLGQGEQSKGDFDQNLAMFASGEARAAYGTYQAVGVGFESHRRLARSVLATPVVSHDDSKMQFKQFLWRISRSAPGKTNARAYYLLDRKVYGLKPLKLICKWIKNVRVHDDGVVMDGRVYLKAAS